MNSLYVAAILVTSFLPGADTVPIRTIKSGAKHLEGGLFICHFSLRY